MKHRIEDIVNHCKKVEADISDIQATLKKLGHDNVEEARKDTRSSVRLLVNVWDQLCLELKTELSREVVFCDEEQINNR